MDKRIFIGQFVSQEESYKDPRISQAGNNYQLKFLKMIEADHNISLIPVFLRNSSGGGLAKEIFIINTPSSLPNRLHYVYRFFADSFKTLRIVKTLKTKHIFFYNIDSQNFGIIFLAKFILQKNIFVIIADYSSHKNKMGMDRIFNFILKHADGAIVFNSNIKINSNQYVMPGLIEENILEIKEQKPKKHVLMSGSLGKTTGFEIALKAFSKLPDFYLHITGRPYGYSEKEFQEMVNTYTDRYNNIQYYGLLSYDHYLKILSKCDIALSLRNPMDMEHQYNFPSKILEYLSKSKLVISTLRYNDIPEAFLFYSTYTPQGLIKCLENIFQLSDKTILNLKRDIHGYLKKHFTQSALSNICNKIILNA